jgi:glycosyltransferase involved in cell wall biosynthesis
VKSTAVAQSGHALQHRYAIISPAKDEEAYAAKTIESVAGQSIRPVRWVIVDDGSRDRTAEIAGGYSERYPWISVERIRRDLVRNPGPAVVAAFNAGLQKLSDVDYDFLVKLDMDLILPPDYFEKLLSRFTSDEGLGIASGVYLESLNGQWEAIQMPAYHAAGASKVMRRECFEAIGGYSPNIGWDTIDEIRARALGWNTCHFADLRFQHLRREGRGTGMLRNSVKYGVADYVMGGSLFFLLFKVPYRMLRTKPFLLGGLAILWGYLGCVFTGRKRLVTKAEAKLYRNLLRSQLWGRWRKASPESGISSNPEES